MTFHDRGPSDYTATDDLAAYGWRKYLPLRDALGVMATCIDHPFHVTAHWGTLSGKPGDYLMKNFQDRDIAYPDDVGVVDQKLLFQTYERTEERK